MSTVFASIPPTAQGHFRLHFYAAVYRLIGHLHRLSQTGGPSFESTLKKFPFLDGYFREILPYLPPQLTWQQTAAWWETEVLQWERTVESRLPLVALSTRLGLDFNARLILLLGGLLEEDSRFSAVFATLQSPLNYRQPCLQLLGQILDDARIDPWKIIQALTEAGAMEFVNRDCPRSEWIPRLESHVWTILRGELEPRLEGIGRTIPTAAFCPLDQLIVAPATQREAEQASALILQHKLQTLIIRAAPGEDALRLLGAVARTGQSGLILADSGAERSARTWKTLALLATMTGNWPVLSVDLGPGETLELAWPDYYRGPCGILLGTEGGLRGQLGASTTLVIPAPSAIERRRLWIEALEQQPAEDLDRLVERFQLPSGHLRQVAATAVTQAALRGGERLSVADARRACRSLNRQSLDSLATPLDTDGRLQRLVVSESTGSKLQELEQRCRFRESLLPHLGLGFGTRCHRGVRALFTGPSGTGKTLAAQILAGQLDMDLYRVDLAAIINKYIGETEKNLHRLLSRAESLDVILLLDEGDSLLGKRSDIRSANDRYANLETNYLLQKLEHYQGVVIVTTNAGDNIDKAFHRRMDVVAHFPPPQAQERWRIWTLHLPATHAIDDAVLEDVALRCSLTGGQIRNAAQHATLLALVQKRPQVSRADLEAAIDSEYRKAGAISPYSHAHLERGCPRDMQTFLDAL